MVAKLNANSHYRVNPEVRFRYEEFGGSIYRRWDDYLFFLKSRLAIDLLELAGSGTVAEIASRLTGDVGNQAEAVRNALRTLAALEELGIVDECPAGEAQTGGTGLPYLADYT